MDWSKATWSDREKGRLRLKAEETLDDLVNISRHSSKLIHFLTFSERSRCYKDCHDRLAFYWTMKLPTSQKKSFSESQMPARNRKILSPTRDGENFPPCENVSTCRCVGDTFHIAHKFPSNISLLSGVCRPVPSSCTTFSRFFSVSFTSWWHLASADLLHFEHMHTFTYTRGDFEAQI